MGRDDNVKGTLAFCHFVGCEGDMETHGIHTQMLGLWSLGPNTEQRIKRGIEVIQKQTQIFSPKWIDSGSQSLIYIQETLSSIKVFFLSGSCPTSVIILSLPTVEYRHYLLQQNGIKMDQTSKLCVLEKVRIFSSQEEETSFF